MKRIIFLLTLGLVFASCEKKNSTTEELQPEQTTTEFRVAGEMTIQIGPNPYVAHDTMVVKVDEKEQVMTIEMQQIKFSDRMPGLDIYADNMPYMNNNNTLLVEQDTVVLTFGPERRPYTDCPLANFRDTLDLNNRQMRFNCTFAHKDKEMGDMPARFVGKFIK